MALADSDSQGELRSVYSTNLLRLLMTQKDTGLKTLTESRAMADRPRARQLPGFRARRSPAR